VGLESKSRGSESRFAAYVEAITAVLGHADRAAPFRSYCAGLLLPGDRKSVEPMAARVQPGRVQAAQPTREHAPVDPCFGERQSLQIKSGRMASGPAYTDSVLPRRPCALQSCSEGRFADLLPSEGHPLGDALNMGR